MTSATVKVLLTDLFAFVKARVIFVPGLHAYQSVPGLHAYQSAALEAADELTTYLQSKGWNIQLASNSPLTSQEGGTALPPIYVFDNIISNVKTLIANIEADIKAPSIETTVAAIENVVAILKNGSSLFTSIFGMHATAECPPKMPTAEALAKCKEAVACHESGGMKGAAVDPIVAAALSSLIQTLLAKLASYFGA
jgi:hypothetical protein